MNTEMYIKYQLKVFLFNQYSSLFQNPKSINYSAVINIVYVIFSSQILQTKLNLTKIGNLL